MTAFAYNAPHTREKVLEAFNDGEKLTTREIMKHMGILMTTANVRKFAMFLHYYMEYAYLRREVIRKQGETVQRVFWKRL